MGTEAIIADSARKHGVTDQDMLHAYRNPVRVFELEEGFVMIIGAGHSAIMLEVGLVQARTAPVDRPRDAGTRKVPEVMTMPRSVEDILKHADELAKRFETYEPKSEDERDPDAVNMLRQAVTARSDAERSVRDAVDHARHAGLPWALIGTIIGTSGEAARQRYGHRHKAGR